jgi:hypothetical protein
VTDIVQKGKAIWKIAVMFCRKVMCCVSELFFSSSGEVEWLVRDTWMKIVDSGENCWKTECWQ